MSHGTVPLKIVYKNKKDQICMLNMNDTQSCNKFEVYYDFFACPPHSLILYWEDYTGSHLCVLNVWKMCSYFSEICWL
jgi:hypothetical protein